MYIQSHETQHREASPTPIAPTLSRYAQGEHQIQQKESSFFPQDPVTFSDDTHPCSFLDTYEEGVSLASLHLPTNSSRVEADADITTWQSPQPTGIPFSPADWHKNLSCLDSVNRQPSLSPYSLCSRENVFCSDNSPFVDSSPLSEETPSIETFSAVDISSDRDRKTISMLAEQIHSLAEIFSQYAKQLPYGTANLSLCTGRPAEDTHLGSPLDWRTSGTVDVPEELPMDEEIISYILTNLLDNDTLNLSTCDLGSSETFNMANSDMQLSLHQMPLTDGTPFPDQWLIREPSDFQVPESQWDGKFYPMLQQGKEG